MAGAAGAARLAEGRGGGVHDSDLFNCVLLDNRAITSDYWNKGGGAYWSRLYNCVLSSNLAYRGGASYDSQLRNCLIWGNSSSIEGENSGSGIFDCVFEEPNFVDREGGDFRLAATSPCIDAGMSVLLDDDFASIVRSVRMGRRIYDHLQKAMTYIVAVHVPIAVRNTAVGEQNGDLVQCLRRVRPEVPHHLSAFEIALRQALLGVDEVRKL